VLHGIGAVPANGVQLGMPAITSSPNGRYNLNGTGHSIRHIASAKFKLDAPWQLNLLALARDGVREFKLKRECYVNLNRPV
jgi:hypothetical protein